MIAQIAALLMTAILQTTSPTPGGSATIEFERVAVLTTQPGAPCLIERENTYGARNARGQFVLFSQTTDRLTVFSADGRCVGEVGRKGKGPGEYTEIVSVGAHADSLFVYDLANHRVTVLGPDMQASRDFRPSAMLGMRIHVSPSGDLVSNQEMRLPAAADLPLHRFGSDGEYIGSFGTAGERSDQSRAFFAGDQVWEAKPSDWVFRQWSRDGRLLRTVQPQRPSWFPGPDVEFDYSLRTPPRAVIKALWLDADDRLWVVARVPGRDWESGIEQRGSRRTVVDYSAWTATNVTVINIRDSSTIATARIEGNANMLEPGLIGMTAYDSRMELAYTVFRPRLRQ